MPGRLVLVCQVATRGSVVGRFPALEAPNRADLDHAALLADRLPEVERAWSGPEPAARLTASALGLPAQVCPALQEVDHGRWAGQTLKGVAAAEPDALARWLTKDDQAPHGGESIAELQRRVARWLRERTGDTGDAIVVVSASVVRAAVCAALDSPAAFRRLDVEPLSLTDLRSDGSRWSLRSAAAI